ncbi:hypothetical protein BDZ89DRAFT_571104 [Hymenopellis radicata]|nr:hypothetical protein BDZ89DRAFT_571104 [Hymenopellis radicata]
MVVLVFALSFEQRPHKWKHALPSSRSKYYLFGGQFRRVLFSGHLPVISRVATYIIYSWDRKRGLYFPRLALAMSQNEIYRMIHLFVSSSSPVSGCGDRTLNRREAFRSTKVTDRTGLCGRRFSIARIYYASIIAPHF